MRKKRSAAAARVDDEADDTGTQEAIEQSVKEIVDQRSKRNAAFANAAIVAALEVRRTVVIKGIRQFIAATFHATRTDPPTKLPDVHVSVYGAAFKDPPSDVARLRDKIEAPWRRALANLTEDNGRLREDNARLMRMLDRERKRT